MRIVVDTNVVVSAFIWGGTPRRLLEAVGDQVRFYTSRTLVEELEGVLTREKFAHLLRRSRFSVVYLISRYTELAQIIAVQPIEPTVIADPPDDAVLACALAAKADLIVSGDRHLRELKEYQGIPIVTPADALKRLALP